MSQPWPLLSLFFSCLSIFPHLNSRLRTSLHLTFRHRVQTRPTPHSRISTPTTSRLHPTHSCRLISDSSCVTTMSFRAIKSAKSRKRAAPLPDLPSAEASPTEALTPPRLGRAAVQACIDCRRLKIKVTQASTAPSTHWPLVSFFWHFFITNTFALPV